MKSSQVLARDKFEHQEPKADLVKTEVIRHSLISSAELMRITLARTAYSSVIYEAIDYCCAIYDRNIRLLAQGKSLPLWLGTMHFCVEAAVRNVGGEEALQPGDILLHTGAYETGSHAQDLCIVVPAFKGDQLVGYATVKAHQMDLAAKHPYCTDTTDYFQEGVIYPGVKLFRAGVLQDDMYRTLIANSRCPEILKGDVNAVIASARVGANALVDVVAKHGFKTFNVSVEQMFDNGERAMRRYLAALPDGTYTGECALDSDGITDEIIPFEVTVIVRDDSVIVDFSKAPGEVGGPVNCPLPTTVSAARFAIVSIAARTEEINEGHFRPISVRTREGTLFHPRPPAPIYLYFLPAMLAVDTVHRAFQDTVTADITAGSGGDLLGIVAWRSMPDGTTVVIMADHPTGQGASIMGDGPPPLTHITCSGGRNTPAEVFENKFPSLTVERVELVPDSGGAGKFRGGLGIDIYYLALNDIKVTIGHERQKTPPWGLHGGKQGRPNTIRHRQLDGTFGRIYKVTDLDVSQGSVIEVSLGGGGGFGPPVERDPQAIYNDIHQGYVTEAAARIDFPHAFKS